MAVTKYSAAKTRLNSAVWILLVHDTFNPIPYGMAEIYGETLANQIVSQLNASLPA